MNDNKFLTSNRLILKPFQQKYITQKYVDWLNDKDVQNFTKKKPYQTIKSCIAFLDEQNTNKNIFLGIFLKNKEQVHIGNIVAYTDYINSRANLTILIGEKKQWGLGYGLEAWNLMLKYLLNDLKIRKVSAGTMSFNLGMLKIMKLSGMEADGIRIQERIHNGKVYDEIYAAKFSEKQ